MKDPEDRVTLDMLTHQHQSEIERGLDTPPPHPDEENPPVIPLYIFDLDGTLANIDHRRHLIERTEERAADWPAFYRACVRDEPNWPVLSTLVTLLDAGCDVWIWSGRSAEVMNQTRTWIRAAISHDRAIEIDLQMRDEGDFTPDEALKAKWLDEMSAADRKRLVAVFDDRDKVVRMWRERGVPCFQVAPGPF